MALHYSLLDEKLIRARRIADGQLNHYSLPWLFVAMQQDEIRDFPALRPHQRHPWHAFLVQLAAMALHQASSLQPFETAQEWREALMNLTPDDSDGAAWCLITPHDRPALMQPPVPGEDVSKWKSRLHAPDELDMLVTSKNHDLKTACMTNSNLDDWLMALISLQTQEGFLGAGNYGISRMNGGFASRPALGVVPYGNWGKRWLRDVNVLLSDREKIVAQNELQKENGTGLIWLLPWDGAKSLSFSSLDPFYIEICRKIRLLKDEENIVAVTTGSKVSRVAAKERNGITGDPWIPIDVAAEKALTITAKGFNYKVAVELLVGKYQQPIAQALTVEDGEQGIIVLAQGVTRGQGKTEGYHERRIPISPTVRKMMLRRKTDRLAALAEERVNAISKMRKVLWSTMATLFDNGATKDCFSDSAKDRANGFAKPFEQEEDARFFQDLNEEIESDDPDKIRLQWLLAMADRAEAILNNAFHAGPRSSEQRYRARSAALSRFHGVLRSNKSPFPPLADHYRQLTLKEEPAHGDA